MLAGNASEYSRRDLHRVVVWIEMNRWMRSHLSGLNATMRLSGEKPINNLWPAHVQGVAKLRGIWFTESFSRCVVVWRKALSSCRMTTNRRRLRPPWVPLLISKRFSCILIIGCDNLQTSGLEEGSNGCLVLYMCAPLNGRLASRYWDCLTAEQS